MTQHVKRELREFGHLAQRVGLWIRRNPGKTAVAVGGFALSAFGLRALRQHDYEAGYQDAHGEYEPLGSFESYEVKDKPYELGRLYPVQNSSSH